jgi:hypothetical protein
MDVTEIVTELTGKGLHLETYGGNIRIWPKEKLTKEDRDLVKAFKKPLLDMLDLQDENPRSERSEHREPNFKVFSREKEHTDDGYTFFSENKVKINVHNVHYVHSSSSEGPETNVHDVHDVHAFQTFLDRPETNVHDVHPQEKYELRQLGAWYFSEGPSGFNPHGDYSEYDPGTHKSALNMLNLVRDLTWPDFEVYVDGSLITLKRVKEKYFPRRITIEWERFVDWWETLGSYPPPGTSFRAFSEEIADQIVARWKEISKKVNKEFLKDFDNYHIEAFQDRVFVSQTRLIPGGPDPEELRLLKTEAAKKIEIELKLTRERANMLVGLK